MKFLLVLLLGAAPFVYSQNYTGLRFETRDKTVHVIIPRVGSGPGEKNVDFVVDLLGDAIELVGEPSRYSQTAYEVDNATAGDTFYWPHSYSVQHFTPNAERNVLGLGPNSDIWHEFSWLEVCPKHGLLFFHKEGSHEDLHHHQCGRGSDVLHTRSCGALPNCTLRDDSTTLEYFGVTRQNDAEIKSSLLIDGAEGTAFIEVSAVNITSAESLGVYGVFSPSAENENLRLYQEYEAKHMHSTTGFVLMESLLFFYLHFVSDRAKNVDGCKWTRYPAYVGNCVAVVANGLIYYHYDLAARIFHASAFFRYHNRHKIVTEISFYTVIVLSVIVHVLITVKKKTLPYRRLHMEVLYELMLQFPLTFALMGGGKFNLMNLLFVFVVTVVVIGSRVRDFMSIVQSTRGELNRHVRQQPVDFMLYLVEAYAFVFYAFIVWLTVWIPAFENLFMLATLPATAAGGVMVVFVTGVARVVSDHQLYTVVGSKKAF